MYVCVTMNLFTAISLSTPKAHSVGGASGPPGLAATATTGQPANLVVSRVRIIFLVICVCVCVCVCGWVGGGGTNIWPVRIIIKG